MLNVSAIVSFLVGLVMAYLGGFEFIGGNSELMDFLPEVLAAGFSFLISGFLKWISGRPQWESFFRMVAMVVNLVRAEAQAGSQNPELRERATALILDYLPQTGLGWRGFLFNVPGVGRWAIGMILDQLVSGYKRLALEDPEQSPKILKGKLALAIQNKK